MHREEEEGGGDVGEGVLVRKTNRNGRCRCRCRDDDPQQPLRGGRSKESTSVVVVVGGVRVAEVPVPARRCEQHQPVATLACPIPPSPRTVPSLEVVEERRTEERERRRREKGGREEGLCWVWVWVWVRVVRVGCLRTSP